MTTRSGHTRSPRAEYCLRHNVWWRDCHAWAMRNLLDIPELIDPMKRTELDDPDEREDACEEVWRIFEKAHANEADA